MSMITPRYPLENLYNNAELRKKSDDSMDKRMKAVEEQLLIIHYEQEMGERFPELKKAYTKYQYELDKIKVFEILKK